MLATRWWFPVARAGFALAVVLTAWVSLLPPDDLPSSVRLSDWLLHGVGYAILGFLAIASGLRWYVAFGVVVAIGVVLEIAQGLLGYRSFELTDILADAVGAGLGVVVATRVLAPLWRRQAAAAQESKREARRQRRADRAQRGTERAMSPAKAAAKKGAPTWQQVVRRQGSKCSLCGTRTHDDDVERRADGSRRIGATFPEVFYLQGLEAGGRADLDNARLAHHHCAEVRAKHPGRDKYGPPKRTFS